MPPQMSDMHRPASRTRSYGAVPVEVLMIGVAVFLGLLADEWRENRAAAS